MGRKVGTKKNGVRERRKGPFTNDVSSVVRVREGVSQNLLKGREVA